MATRAGAIVLAAGRSQRLGRPKVSSTLGGRTFLSLVLEALDDPRIVEHRIVVAPGQSVPGAGAALVENPHPERGQTSSVICGIGALPADLDAILIHPVDVPLVTRADVACVLCAFEAREAANAAAIFVPSHDGRRGHPICFPASRIGDILALGDAPLHRLLRAEGAAVVHVVVPDGGSVVDVDTEADLLRASEIFARRGPEGV
ncbi:MAG: NTP transferase domain-containing protein [Acidobacteriota bacterium]